MVIVTIVYTEGDLKALCQNTCDLLSRWTLISQINYSVSYVVQGETNTALLASGCKAGSRNLSYLVGALNLPSARDTGLTIDCDRSRRFYKRVHII